MLLVVLVLGVLVAATAVAVGRLRSDAVSVACVADQAAVERAATLWSENSDAMPVAGDLVDAGLLRTASQAFELDERGQVVPIAGGPCAGARPGADVAAAGDGHGADPDPRSGGASAPTGTVIDGPLEVSLSWTGNADLDVWVRTPDGAVVGWAEQGLGGGRLDLDVVPSTPDAVGPHVERIVWPHGGAPGGEYVAWADFRTAGWGDQPAASFTLTVRRGDELLATLDGPIGPPGTRAELAATVW